LQLLYSKCFQFSLSFMFAFKKIIFTVATPFQLKMLKCEFHVTQNSDKFDIQASLFIQI
jgi:hypothetical protein